MEARSQHTSATAVAIAAKIMQRLELAWNSADGAAFGEPFSADADFVAIRGDLHTGRAAIAAGHQQIFATIYAGSTARYEALQARELDERVIVAHVRGTIDAPGGPLAGKHASTITVVLLRQGDEYEITALHNTLISGLPVPGMAGRMAALGTLAITSAPGNGTAVTGRIAAP